MFGRGITFYARISDRICWKPHWDWVLGEATHFYHPTAGGAPESYPDGVPLNKEWSVSFGWLFLFVSITATIDVEIPKELRDE